MAEETKSFMCALKILNRPKQIVFEKSEHLYELDFDGPTCVNYEPFKPSSDEDFVHKKHYGLVENGEMLFVWILRMGDAATGESDMQVLHIKNPSRKSFGNEKISFDALSKSREKILAKKSKKETSKRVLKDNRNQEMKEIGQKLMIKNGILQKAGKGKGNRKEEKDDGVDNTPLKKWKLENSKPVSGDMYDDEGNEIEDKNHTKNKTSESVQIHANRKQEMKEICQKVLVKDDSMQKAGKGKREGEGKENDEAVDKISLKKRKLENSKPASGDDNEDKEIIEDENDYLLDESEDTDEGQRNCKTKNGHSAEELLRKLKEAEERVRKLEAEAEIKRMAKELAADVLRNIPELSKASQQGRVKCSFVDEIEEVPVPEGVLEREDAVHVGCGFFLKKSTIIRLNPIMNLNSRIKEFLKELYPDDVHERFLSCKVEEEGKKPIHVDVQIGLLNVLTSMRWLKTHIINKSTVNKAIRHQTDNIRAQRKFDALSEDEKKKKRVEKCKKVKEHREKKRLLGKHETKKSSFDSSSSEESQDE